MRDAVESIILSRELGAIRDSRIACKSGFRDTPSSRSASEVRTWAFLRRLRAWRERNNLSQSQAALKLQISKRTLQEWEQGRAAPRGLARTAIEKTIRGQHTRTSLLTNITIRESRIASRMSTIAFSCSRDLRPSTRSG